jgi:hypothetical protein
LPRDAELFDFWRGNLIPAQTVFSEPPKMAFEDNRTPIADGVCAQARHATSKHLAANNFRGIAAALKVELDRRPGHQSMTALHEDAAARHVDDFHVITGPDARRHDAVFSRPGTAVAATTVGCTSA